MTGVGAGVRELLPAIPTLEGLLSTVYPEVLLKVMFELERLVAVVTLELAEKRALVVTDHVPLQTVHVGEALVADLAGLQQRGRLKRTCLAPP